MFSAILLLTLGFITGMYLTNAKFRHPINITLLKMLYAVCWGIEQVEDRWGEIQPLPKKPIVKVDRVPETPKQASQPLNSSTAMQIWQSVKSQKVPHLSDEKSLEQLLKENPELDVEPAEQKG